MKSERLAIIDIHKQHLRQLTFIRTVLLIVLWLSFGFSVGVNLINFPRAGIAVILSLFSLVHILTILRLRQSLVIVEIEFFIQLLIDVVCLNSIFYFSGGATNPFISYLLVPICISAATLPWRFTWIISALCIVAYSLLLFFHVSLPIFELDHRSMNTYLNWHILGMWFNFFVSAILITYFVVKMAKSLQEKDYRLNQMREDELRNEQLIAVATLAAGTAHEINTPLASISVLLAELQHEYKDNAVLQSDLGVLSSQVNQCVTRLKHMVDVSSTSALGELKLQCVEHYCSALLERWAFLRPEVDFALTISEVLKDYSISCDSRLDHAIINLLNNAADENPINICVDIGLDGNQLSWIIIDEGKGISDDVARRLGKEKFSSKKFGLGLGMLLTHTTIKRYGGSVEQLPNKPRGTITKILLPLKFSLSSL